MRDPKTHQRALRAALQVARGNRRQTAAALTGVVMLTGCSDDPGATNGQTGDTVSAADSGGHTAGDAVQALIDALDAAADPGPVTGDATDGASSAPDATQGDSTASSAPDGAEEKDVDDQNSVDTHDSTASSAPDGADEQDSVDNDDILACIDSCWQSNDTMCTAHADCNVPEVLGLCEVNGAPCNWGDKACPDGEVCEGYEAPKEVYLDPSTGEPSEWNSGLECIDGVCHEGDQFSLAAQACCSGGLEGEDLPWCEGMGGPMPGCTPWGPPAPPAFDGMTLAQRVQRWLS